MHDYNTFKVTIRAVTIITGDYYVSANHVINYYSAYVTGSDKGQADIVILPY